MIGDTNYGRSRERGLTAAAMAAANPVLSAREFASTVDGTSIVLRMGDGVTPWNDLPNILPHPEGSGGGGGGALYEQATTPAVDDPSIPLEFWLDTDAGV